MDDAPVQHSQVVLTLTSSQARSRFRSGLAAEHAHEEIPFPRPRLRRTGLGGSNQLRVWRTPLFVAGQPVWVGSISYYIGRPTEIGRALFDARIDPNMDVGRDYILQATWYTQSLAAIAWHDAGPPLSIPVNAEGAEALFDVFASLPGMATSGMIAELRSRPREPVMIWERDPLRLH